MLINWFEQYGATAARWCLRLLVHLDAFRAAPRAYLKASRWWLQGKRLRARGQLAPLLSQSPRAYALWAWKMESTEKGHLNHARFGAPIVAVVDIRSSLEGLDDTMRSLFAQGVPTLLINSTSLPTFLDTSSQMDWSENPWLMPMASGDTIAPGSIEAYRKLIAELSLTDQASKIIYADDDLLSRGARQRHTPHFKPDWNSELFHHFDYLTGSCIVRTSKQDWETLADANDWAEQLVIRVASQGVPLHLRQMLHHRRARPAPRVPAALITPYHDLPSVTIIIPTRNHVNLLRTCLEGIATTRYPDIQVIVVDNDSDDPQTLSYLDALDSSIQLLRHAGVFNYSAINNRAAGEARGHLLCLLNNDIEVIDPNWLATMAVQARREDVGAVGARLLYPDGRIQHAGVAIGMGNAAGHAHRFLHPDEEGYFRRHALPQFTSAVTAACLVVEREKFLGVGGLDEANFPVAFNDVDLCLRLNQRGWQSLYEPRATLIHHESVSRGLDQDVVGAARFAGELAALKRLWNTDEIVDPYHHPQLSRASERFAVAI